MSAPDADQPLAFESVALPRPVPAEPVAAAAPRPARSREDAPLELALAPDDALPAAGGVGAEAPASGSAASASFANASPTLASPTLASTAIASPAVASAPARPPRVVPTEAERAARRQQQVRAFFRAPEAGIDALGRIDGAGRDALALLDAVSASQRRLTELNQGLVPLIARFREPGTTGRFWRWFSGEALEHELSFGHVCREVEASAELGVMETGTIRELIARLGTDRERLDDEIDALEDAIALGRLIASDRYEKLRAATGAPPETWQRLSRRVGNLEAMATSLRLTQSQYAMAIEHGKTIVARFDEIRTLLIPIWYQRMGFQLFSRRVDDTDAPVSRQGTRP